MLANPFCSDPGAGPRQASGALVAGTIFRGLPDNPREAAERLLGELMVREQTINLSSLVNCFRDCDLMEADIRGDGYCLPAGLLSKKTLIVIPSKGQGEERRRFTLAHELGHLACHYRDNRDLILDEERWCDTFASELLMPKTRVAAFARTVTTLADWLKFPQHFKVSRLAAARQLWEYCSVAMVTRRLNAEPGDPRYDALRSEMIALAQATAGSGDRFQRLSDGTECFIREPRNEPYVAVAQA